MTTRKTADERRIDILEAAKVEFGRFGYHGGSTERIAAACEISQPYVLRLFGSKLKLYLATHEAVTSAILARWESALSETDDRGWQALMRIGPAYGAGASAIEFRMILQSAAAADVPEIEAISNAGMDRLWNWVQQHTGATDDEMQRFWAFGMMLTMGFAMNAENYQGSSARARAMVNLPGS